MPSLADVLTAFPQGHFLINYKSKEAREGGMLAAFLAAHPEWQPAVWGVYGGGPPTEAALQKFSGLRGYTVDSIKACLLPYLGVGLVRLHARGLPQHHCAGADQLRALAMGLAKPPAQAHGGSWQRGAVAGSLRARRHRLVGIDTAAARRRSSRRHLTAMSGPTKSRSSRRCCGPDDTSRRPAK